VRNGPRFWGDYVNGALVTWREHSEGVDVHESIHDRLDRDVTIPPATCPRTRTRDVTIFARRALKNIETFTVELGSETVTSKVHVASKGTPGFPDNYTLNYHLLEVYHDDCSGFQPVSRQETGEPVYNADALDVSPGFTGFTLQYSLNGRVDGSILRNWMKSFLGRNPPPETATFVGDISLGADGGLGTRFIAEGSPLGEVFVARADKGVIVYRPLPSSRMPPTLEIPPHIVKLVAALWF
jgi:hypothetical protein